MLFKRCPECGKFMKNYNSAWECHKCGIEFSKTTKEVMKIPRGCVICGMPHPICKKVCPLGNKQ